MVSVAHRHKQFMLQNLLVLSAVLPVQKPRNVYEAPFLCLGKSPLWSNPVLINGFRILKWERGKGNESATNTAPATHRANSLLNWGRRERNQETKRKQHTSQKRDPTTHGF